MCLVVGCAITISSTLLIFSKELLGIFNTDPEVINFGVHRFWCTLPLLFICGLMEVMTGGLRGMGYSAAPTSITLFFICVMRVIWLYTIFRWFHSLEVLMISYPVTWILNTIGIGLLLKRIYRKEKAIAAAAKTA